MPIRLDDRDARFEQQFQALLSAKREVSEEVDRVVADIIADVRERATRPSSTAPAASTRST